jgi:hypothetical protein
MRKRVIGQEPPGPASGSGAFLDLERVARVEITSEDPEHPIESALVAAGGDGWRAGAPGTQKIRLVFDEPRKIRRIRLVCVEPLRERTQEFALSWIPSGQEFRRLLVRQQYTFSPGGSTREVEEYAVDLDRAAVLELEIVPDISGGDTRATFGSLQVA